MEKVKDPAMMLSLGNTVGLIGASAYFYKQNEALKEEVAELKTTIKNLTGKLEYLSKEIIKKDDKITTIDRKVRNMNSNFDTIEYDIDEIVEDLNAHEIQIDRASRSKSSRRSREHSRDRNYSKKYNVKDKGDRNEERVNPRDRRNERSRPDRNSHTEQIVRPYPGESSANWQGSDDEDSDSSDNERLIEQVRNAKH